MNVLKRNECVEERTRLPRIGPRSSSAGKLSSDPKHGTSSARIINSTKAAKTDAVFPVETRVHRDVGESGNYENMPFRLKKLQLDDDMVLPIGCSVPDTPSLSTLSFDPSNYETPVLNPESDQFLREMQNRYSPASVCERMNASRQRAREGSEAVLTFELLLQTQISENDPALASSNNPVVHRRPSGSRRLPTPTSREDPSRTSKPELV